MAALEAVGSPADAARTVAQALVDADLRGLDSHGVVARLPGYVERVRRGGIVADAQVATIRDDGGPIAVLDGRDGFGQVVAMACVQRSQELAQRHGVGLVAARASNHLGALGYYTRLTAEKGFIGYAASGGGPRIAPWGGAEPLLATNPWSWAFPADSHPPMVIDVSNGAVLTGAVDGPASRSERIPLGWALDGDGRPTDDAAAGSTGSLLAFGGAKGTALTLALEMLVSVLTGALYSRQVPSLADPTRPQGLGHLFITLEVGRFMDPAELYERTGELLGWVEDSRPVEGGPPVRIPGERGNAVAADRQVHGVPVRERLEPLSVLAQELAIAPLTPAA